MKLQIENEVLRRLNESQHKVYIYTLLICTMVLIASSSAAVWSSLQPKEPHHCGSFGSYAGALVDFKRGNAQLDGNKDGIPCENLYKASLRTH